MTVVPPKLHRRLASLAALLLATSLTTCRLDDLLKPGEIGALAATPVEVADSAFAGSTAIRQHDIALRVDGTGERLRFSVDAEFDSDWIILGPATGTAPGTYSISVDPAGLTVGEYVDTIRFTAEGPDVRELRVPVRFKLQPCAVTDLGALPASASGTLTTSDCASVRFADRLAKRFRFTAQANDSVTVTMSSSAFAPSLALERAGVATPLASSDGCSIVAGSGAACVRYVLLANTDDYIVEATTSAAGATGAFQLSVGRPRPPVAPTALNQLTVATPAQPVAVGAAISTTQLTLQATLGDVDLDSMRLQVELRPVAAAFTGVPTHASALAGGTQFSVLVGGLLDGTSYKWRARAIDVTGRTSAWVEFGGNATDAADVTITVPEAPAPPTGLSQRRDDGVTAIPLLGTTDETAVRLGATVSDADVGDLIRLEVEVRPMGTAIQSIATHSSVPVPSGTFAVVPVSGLLDDVGYRWQVRAVDQSGRASAWVRFSPSGETFRVALPPTQLAFVVEPSVVAAGAAIAPSVQVAARDAAGATLTSYGGDITLALGDAPIGATLGGTLTVTAVDGVATFSDLTVDRVGAAVTLVASAGALNATSDPFSVVAATASTLEFTAQPSDAVAGATIAPAVTVVARDAFGNIATGFNGTISLALASNGAGATLLGATTVAAVNGIATFGGLRVERAGTGLSLVASAGGFSDAVSSAFTVAPATAAALRLLTAPSTTGAAGVALATQPVVVADDAFGNRVRLAGRVITATIATGPTGTLVNAQATTDANGAAAFAGLAISGSSGSYTLGFASAGVTGIAASPITLAAGGAARLALTVAPSTTVTSGSALAVGPVVQLQDAAGNAVAQGGVAIAVAIASGAPALTGTTSVLTDASGEATFTDLVITGSTGARTLAFSAPGLSGVTSSAIDVTAGAAVEMSAVAGNGQVATVGTTVAIPPSVVVGDASGNPVPGVAVNFVITGGGGSVVPPSAVITNASGIATLTSWTLGASVGTNTLEARVDGLAGSPVVFAATGEAGAASQLTITGGNDLSGPVGSQLGTPHEVRVTDANGNPVSGISITWAATGGGSVSSTITPTDDDGRATTVRTLGPTAGPQGTTASAMLAGGATTVTFTLTATTGGASQMALSAGDLQVDTVGATLPTPLAVVVRDALNNPVQGVLITWSVVDGGGSIAPTTSLTNAAGIASASWTLGTGTTAIDSSQLARASGVGSPVTFVATTRPGAVSAAQTTVVVAPATVAASRGTPALVTVTARDGFGNPIRGRTVTLAADGVGNTIAQPAATTNANGVTTGGIGATTIGARTIVASVDGVVVTQQPTFTVVAAPAAQLVFTASPSAATAGTSMVPPPEVGVIDSLGNRNFAFTGAVTLGLATNPGAGTLSGTLTRNAVGGVASFPGLALDRAASGYAFVATATGLGGTTSGTFTVGVGGVSAARSTIGSSATTLVAGQDTATITVTARDASDNPIAGATVTLAATGAASAIEQPLAVTDANGVATGRVSATTSGLRTISASIGSTPVTATTDIAVVPATVSATVSTISALPTTVTAGGGATTVTVTARDAFGNAIPGATVVLAVTGSGNGITQPVETDSLGVTTGTVASTVAGTKTISATVNGVALSTTTALTVTAGAISGAMSTVSLAPGSIVAGDGASTVTVTARDAQGNPVAGAAVVISATGAGNTITQPVATTDASGVATGTIASAAAGTKTVSATIGGTPVTATAQLTVTAGAVSATLSSFELAALTMPAGGPAVTVTVIARDASGNLVADQTVELAATGTGNTVTQPATVTDANGVAAGSVTSTDAGVKVISVSIAGVTLVQTAELTVTAGAVSATQSSLVASPDALTTDGGTSTITVTARDANGNPIAGASVVLSATGADNELGQPVAATDANGVATGTFSSTAAGEKVITATISGVAISQSDTITVGVGAISATTSTLAAADDTISAVGGSSVVTVTARDANGNPVAGQAVVLGATGGGNSITQPVGVTDANGVATGALASTGAGSKIVSATIGGLAITATDTVVVIPGPVVVAQSTIEASSATISAAVGSSVITVTARDQHGNAVPGVAVVLAATGTGNTLTQPTAVTGANGQVAGSIASTVSEAKTVSATLDGVALPTTVLVTVVPDAVSAAQSTVVIAPMSISADGETSTVTVTARDANGNPIAGVSVALAATGSGNAITQPVATTDASGVATGTIASTVVGTKTVSATVNGVAVTQTQSLTVTPGAISGTASTIGAAPTAIPAGGASTITLTARDQHGNAIAGATATIAATGAGNTLTQPAAVTDAAGVTTATLVGTLTGEKVVSATIGDVALTTTATVTVSAGPVSDTASRVVVAAESFVAGGAGTSVTFTARDAYGNTLGGRQVTFTVSGSGNTLTQPNNPTNGSTGQTTGSFTSTVAGQKIVTATIDGTVILRTDTVTVQAGAVSAVQSTVVADPAALTAGAGSSTVTMTARDALGNPIAGAAVTFAASGSSNALVQPAPTDANGVTTGSFSSTGAGLKEIIATIAGVQVTQRDTVTVSAAAISDSASSIVAAPDLIASGDGASTVTVIARDAFGNPIQGVTVVLAATGTGNALIQPASVTGANGTATGSLASTVAGAKIITATLDGLALLTTDTVTVSAGAVSAALSTVGAAPTSVSADGGSSTVTVTARDANGNAIAGATVVISATGSGNTVTQPVGVTDANGVVTGSVSSTIAGTKTISATIGGIAVTGTTTVTVTVGAVSASASTLTAAPGTIIAATGTSTVTVTARDANGNLIAGAAVVFAATGAGNTLADTNAVTDANGVATMTFSSTNAGAKAVSATIAGTTVTQTAAIGVTAGNVSAALSTVATSTTSLVAGSDPATITVTARDANGNPVEGVAVTIAATGANNTITQPAVTDANGVTTGTISSTASGDRIVSATIDAVLATQTQTITVAPAAVSGTTSTIGAVPTTIVAGSEQSTITVTARDEFSNLVPGVTVVLAATGAGNTVVQPVAVTDANGVATGTLSATTAGNRTVSATVNGAALSTTTSVTVTPGGVSSTQSSVAVAPGSISADGGAATVTITARDANGNPVEGAAVTIAVTGSGNTVTQPVGVTNASGEITGSVSSTGAGTKTISAMIGGTPITPTADLVVTVGAVTAAQSSVAADPASIVAGGATSTITVTARDQHGNVVAGASVTLAATGTNTLTQPVGVTAADGTITGTLASTQTGAKVVTATIGAIEVTQTATVTVTPAAVAAAQSTVAVSAATIAAGTGSTDVTVTARDQYGNAVPGVAVVIAAAPTTGNTITQPASVTDANGEAVGSFSSTTSESKTISATADGVAITQTQAVNVVPDNVSGAQSSLVISDASIVAGTATTVTVTARDANGNPVSGVTVVIAASGAGNTVDQPLSTTDVNGVATGTVSSVTAGAKTISATVDGIAVTQTQALTVTPAAVSDSASTVVASPNAINADDGTSTITVTALDAFGNAVAGRTVALSATGDGNTLVQPSVVTDANGVASGTLTSTASGAKVVSATIDGLALERSDTVAVTPGAVSAATTTVVADPTTLTAGSGSSTITVTARDQHGNAIEGAAVTLALASGSASLVQPSTTTDASGVATGSLSATGAGDKIVSATVAGTPITQTATVAVSAGAVSAATSSVAVDPATLTASTGSSATQVTVTARDVNNNPVAGATVVLAASGNGNTITQPAGPTDANGVATGMLSSTGAGTKAVSATVSSVTITQTADVTVAPAVISDTASRVIATDQSFVAGGAGTDVTLAARDVFGNPIGGLTATFVVSGGGNSLTQPAQATDANTGETVGSFTSTEAGPKVITATIGGVLIAHTDTVTVTAGAASPATSEITASVSGITTDLTALITVQLRDASGNLLTASGGSVTLATSHGLLTSVTDAGDGTYTATLSATTPGTATITGALNSVAITDDATVTVIVGAASATTTQLTPASPTMTTDESVVITVQLRDASGNDVGTSGGTVTLATSHGSLTAVTDVGDGTYTATLTATTVGTATITGELNNVAIIDDATVTVSAGAASPATSQIDVSSTTMTTDESVAVTVQLRDAAGNPLLASGGTVVLTTSHGALSAVNDNADGTYSATLSASTPGTSTISGTVNAVAITDGATVTVSVGVAAAATTQITIASPTMTTDESVVVTVQLRDAAGNDLSVSAGIVTLVTSHGALTAVTDNANGTYSATLTATTPGTATITGELDSAPITDDATVTVSVGAASAVQSQITIASAAMTTDDTVLVTVQLRDAAGNDLIASAGTVTLATTHGSLTGVTDNGDGTYTALLSADTPGTAAITGELDSTPISDDATVTVSVGAPDVDATEFETSQTNLSLLAGETATLTVIVRDAKGNRMPTGGLVVTFQNSNGAAGSVGSVTDNGDGSYTATFSPVLIGSSTITAIVGGVPKPQTRTINVGL